MGYGGTGVAPYQIRKNEEEMTPDQKKVNTYQKSQQYPIIENLAARGKELYGEGFQSNKDWQSSMKILRDTYQHWGFSSDFLSNFDKGGTLLGD
jgi:hypothetical protein